MAQVRREVKDVYRGEIKRLLANIGLLPSAEFEDEMDLLRQVCFQNYRTLV